MKQFLFPVLFFATFGLGNRASGQGATLAYTPTYSSQFVMGNAAHTQLVLNLIKDYETNTFSMASAFADTVLVIFADGNTVRGAAAMVDRFKQGRAQYTNPKITIVAVLPTHSTDRNEDWVLVWGTLTGGTDSLDFHQIWRINKAGKIDFIHLYEGKTPKAP